MGKKKMVYIDHVLTCGRYVKRELVDANEESQNKSKVEYNNVKNNLLNQNSIKKNADKCQFTKENKSSLFLHFMDYFMLKKKEKSSQSKHDFSSVSKVDKQITRDTNFVSIIPRPLVPPNPFLNVVIPEWLVIYSIAPKDFDNQLRWDVFTLDQLEAYEAILKRLYMQELEKIVMKYEKYRMLLSKQLEICIYNNSKTKNIKPLKDNSTVCNKDVTCVLKNNTNIAINPIKQKQKPYYLKLLESNL